MYSIYWGGQGYLEVSIIIKDKYTKVVPYTKIREIKMKIYKILFLVIICSLSSQANAQSNEERAISEIEYAVKQISRICPTYMWDSWKFRDIMYEKESNTVYFVIQLKKWKNVSESITPEKMKEQTYWIVENFKEAYESLISDKSLYCDGDFMLYLSVGTLLHKLAMTDANLQIVLLKPDQECVIQKDIPMVVDGKGINRIFNKE